MCTHEFTDMTRYQFVYYPNDNSGEIDNAHVVVRCKIYAKNIVVIACRHIRGEDEFDLNYHVFHYADVFTDDYTMRDIELSPNVRHEFVNAMSDGIVRGLRRVCELHNEMGESR